MIENNNLQNQVDENVTNLKRILLNLIISQQRTIQFLSQSQYEVNQYIKLFLEMINIENETNESHIGKRETTQQESQPINNESES